jgi:anti-sigma B factor antagonist
VCGVPDGTRQAGGDAMSIQFLASGTGSSAPQRPERLRLSGPLTLTRRSESTTVTIALYGELDLRSIATLERELREAEAGDARRVILDLSGLDFLDSCGLGAILNAHRRLEHDDAPLLELVRGPERVHRVFELTGATDILRFVD